MQWCFKFLALIIFILSPFALAKPPEDFVYLSDIDPTILQEIRYATAHNFIGEPIRGYQKPICMLTKKAALQLKEVQSEIYKKGYSLKVYDCYRPRIATKQMLDWSQNNNQLMKLEFYPRVKKEKLLDGYIAAYSGHNRGSTVDLTIVKRDRLEQEQYQSGQPLMPCYVNDRFKDNSIDMGTGFDCLDIAAHFNYSKISIQAKRHRKILRQLMKRYGFKPYQAEWWHFTLKNEPHKRTYFEFPIT